MIPRNNIGIKISNTLISGLLLLIAFPKNVKAQNKDGLGIIMSATTGMSGVQSNSGAIMVATSANCLDVKSGLAVISAIRGAGSFAINCEVKQQFNTLGIKLYPNPVAQITRVKFINTPPLTDEFNISLSDISGNKVDLGKQNGYTLYQGYNLDLCQVIAGTYFLQITSANYLEIVKVIKIK